MEWRKACCSSLHTRLLRLLKSRGKKPRGMAISKTSKTQGHSGANAVGHLFQVEMLHENKPVMVTGETSGYVARAPNGKP
jgi:hypothetical protein